MATLKIQPPQKKLFRHLYWSFFLLISFLVSLGASWLVLAPTHFAYPLLYDYAGIGENIETYAPKNRYKENFIETSRELRISLFVQMLQSVQQQGNGLKEIRYQTKNKQKIDLLTKAEIEHLQDVANLFDVVKIIMAVSFIIFLLMLFIHHKKNLSLPKNITLVKYSLIIPMLTGFIIIIGAEKVFYKLHELIFPTDHQWFFYYEESLMSTLMKAPDLFAYITIMLIVVAVIINIVLIKTHNFFIK